MEKDKPPILGLIQRGGQVVLHMVANVQLRLHKPKARLQAGPSALREAEVEARTPLGQEQKRRPVQPP